MTKAPALQPSPNRIRITHLDERKKNRGRANVAETYMSGLHMSAYDMLSVKTLCCAVLCCDATACKIEHIQFRQRKSAA